MFGFVGYNVSTDAVTETDTATVTIDTLAGMTHTWVMAQNTTINFTNTGLLTVLLITCDATPRTITWGTGAHSPASTYVLTASKKHVLNFIYDGTASEHVLIATPAVLS